jgi:hypothetical protein
MEKEKGRTMRLKKTYMVFFDNKNFSTVTFFTFCHKNLGLHPDSEQSLDLDSENAWICIQKNARI